MVLLFKVAFLLSAGVFFLPSWLKKIYVLMVAIILALTTSVWAIDSLSSDQPLIINLGISFWVDDPEFVIDKLTAFFILIINFTSLTGMIYSIGYLKPYFETKTPLSLSLHLFSLTWLQASMLQVVSLRSGIPFLISWEMMSLSSFLLVIFENEKQTTLQTGISYLIQMHIGFILIMTGFLFSYHNTGKMGFDSLTEYFAYHSNIPLFILFFIGFGIKAGIVPLHSWLPHAHPAAPSHVSGIMSGVMIKMGIFGMIRVLSTLQSDWLSIGIILLIAGIITGITGITYALFQNDIKKTLAYSSIENIGIIVIGLGMAMIGKGIHNPILEFLGMSGAFFHILNHSLYKSMLFYTAGNVYFATHTRDQNELGGIVKNMPWSTVFFLVGSIAICGIPPFNGFISEFLIYSGAFQTIGKASFGSSLLSLGIILSMVLIGGLAVITFTKTFGLTFLGTRRGPSKFQVPKEVPFLMRVPGLIILGVMLSISLVPSLIMTFISLPMAVFPLSVETNYLSEISHSTHNTLTSVGIVNLVVTGFFIFIYAIRSRHQKTVIVDYGPTWGCGYTAGDSTHQYTSTSYADAVGQLAGKAVMTSRTDHRFEEDDIFPGKKLFQTTTKDLLEEKLILKPIRRIIELVPKAGWAQTGMISHYLIYPLVFMILIGILSFLNFI